jgi:hypothetical protein
MSPKSLLVLPAIATPSPGPEPFGKAGLIPFAESGIKRLKHDQTKVMQHCLRLMLRIITKLVFIFGMVGILLG